MALTPAPVPYARLGRVGRVQVANTLVPGTLALADIAATFHASLPLEKLAGKNAAVNGWALAVAVFLGLVAAYIAGVAMRSLGFSLLRTARWIAARRAPAIRDDLSASLGTANVDSSLAEHPALSHALAATRKIGDAAWIDALDYSKYWLREHHPQIGVDQHEVEIGFWASISVPLAALPLAVTQAAGWEWAYRWPVATAAALVAIGFAVWRTHRRSVEESRDALRSFCFAHWFGPGPTSG